MSDDTKPVAPADAEATEDITEPVSPDAAPELTATAIEPADEVTETAAAAPVAEESVEAAAPAEKPKARARKAEPAPAPEPKGYAVIETGGKQYRVSVGDKLRVEKLATDQGSDITIDRVLLVGGNGATRVGTPVVEGASVVARIEGHQRGEKLVVFKYKAKKRYRRRIGHRQALTQITITSINA